MVTGGPGFGVGNFGGLLCGGRVSEWGEEGIRILIERR